MESTTLLTDPLLSTQEVSRITSIKPRTIERWRLLGQGPGFIRVGEKLVRYRLSEVDRWIKANETKAA